MRALALNNGVADADILLDPSGLNTATTTRNTPRRSDGGSWRSAWITFSTSTTAPSTSPGLAAG
jgi:hypothetical protein